MKLTIRRWHLAASVILASIIGYPLVATLSTGLNLDSQVFAIAMRGLVAAIAAILILFRMRIHSRTVFILFCVFWGAYLLRLGYAFGLEGEIASQPANIFFIWGIGVCLIPALAILGYNGKIEGDKIGHAIASLGMLAMGGILIWGGTAIVTDNGIVGDQNRWNLNNLNPITIGHIAASLILVASAALLYGKSSALKIFLYAVVALTGVIGLFLANSRGPLVAMVVAIGMYGLAQIRNRRTWRYTIVFFMLGLAVIYRNAGTIFASGGLLDRFASVLTGEDSSAVARGDLYAEGYAQFLSSPFVGDGVEVRTQMSYPHNVVLEAFMTTGLIGGTAFLLLTLLALRAAFRIMKFAPHNVVIALLAVQYIVAAQLSGSVYQSGAMWVLVAGVLSVPTVLGRNRYKSSGLQVGSDKLALRSSITVIPSISSAQSKSIPGIRNAK